MLALTRYKDESIRIGDNIDVTVIEVRGDRVRLGIVAPKGISVWRTELLDEPKENRLPPTMSRCRCGELPKCHSSGDEPLEY